MGAHCAHGAIFNRVMPAALCVAPPGAGVCVNIILVQFGGVCDILASSMIAQLACLPAVNRPGKAPPHRTGVLMLCTAALWRFGGLSSSQPAPFLVFCCSSHSTRRFTPLLFCPLSRPSTDTPSGCYHCTHATAERKPTTPPFRFFLPLPSTS